MTDTSLATVLERGILARNAVSLSFWEGAAVFAAVLVAAVVVAYIWSVAEDAVSSDAAGEGAE